MTFPPGAQAKRTNLCRITATERDHIVADLRQHPEDIEAIAERFGRGVETIDRIRQCAGLPKRRA